MRKCNFCGNDEKSVKKLISGPNCFICDECVGDCASILKQNDIPLPTEEFNKFSPEIKNLIMLGIYALYEVEETNTFVLIVPPSQGLTKDTQYYVVDIWGNIQKKIETSDGFKLKKKVVKFDLPDYSQFIILDGGFP